VQKVVFKSAMKLLFCLLFAGFVMSSRADNQTNSASVETIVCIRHGEKPKGGLGQLTCRGLNRALALPKVLIGKFGKPQFIFASNPSQKIDELPPWLQKPDDDKYFYVRPLASIEPTAIECGLPVNIEFGFLDITNLESELMKPQYQNATVFVDWEHILLDDFGKNMVKDNGGDVAQVPEWSNDDYDMLFVIKITTENGQKKFSFTVDREGLNSLGDDCP
jgi:hypothetical protein